MDCSEQIFICCGQFSEHSCRTIECLFEMIEANSLIIFIQYFVALHSDGLTVRKKRPVQVQLESL